jgi:alpha-1,2-glucosyltransferase
MLYFWPYVVFFSIPLTIGPILSPIIRLLPNGPKSFLQNNITGISQSSLPSLFAATLCILSGLAAVHYNTIIHPYTLADNRHYVFYVFRILQRHPAIKYLAVPIYYLCAWMAFRTLELKPQSQDQTQIKQDSRDSIKPNPVAPSSHQSCQISFVIAWVATTTLSVATAPLVEPRYFIIPYIIWRLHVPCLSSSSSISGSGSRKTSYDLRLVLETLWLLTVNALLGYMFLYRGFEWPQEPGRVQRFLW